jgi:hypothetical protein
VVTKHPARGAHVKAHGLLSSLPQLAS